jgi:hypothetical protein
MAVLEREFYRGVRGPLPTDEDVWWLVFDQTAGKLVVRHEWEAERYNGVDDFEVAEFLAQEGAAQTALLRLLFTDAMAEA